MCEQQGRVAAATVADHIEPHNGDAYKFWYGRLQSLCLSCHNAIKQMQEKHGYSQACDMDGNPIDCGHPWNKGGKHA